MVAALLLLAQAAAGEVVDHVRVDGVDLDVAASSVLVERRRDPLRYRPGNVVDEDPRTVWSEGVAGDGLGQWIELRFPEPTALLGVELLPGHAGFSENATLEDVSLWAANNVVTEFELLVDGRLYRDHAWTLDYDRVARYDETQHTASDITFFFPFGKPTRVTKVRLVVRGVHRGSRYRDTCVATFRPVIADASGAALGDGVVAHSYRFAHAKPAALEGFLADEDIRLDWGDDRIRSIDRREPRRGPIDPRAAEALRGAARFLREALASVPVGSMFFVDWSDSQLNVLLDERESLSLTWKRDPAGRKLESFSRGPHVQHGLSSPGIGWN